MPVISLPPDAYALRPVRVDAENNRFIEYEAVTFPNGPREGCALYLRRCEAFGYLRGAEDSGLVVDVLNAEGDIVAEYPITRDGFEYLRSRLKFKRGR